MLPQEDLIIFLLKQIQLKTEIGRTGAKTLALKRRTVASVRAGRGSVFSLALFFSLTLHIYSIAMLVQE